MSSALKLRNVEKRYGRTTALADLSIDVPEGSIFGLVGSNGAGKTTLMSVAAGLVRPQAGQIDLLGSGPFDPAAHGGRIALLPQDSRLPFYARVTDLLTYYARLQGQSCSQARASVEEVLEWVRLSDRAHAKVRALSHGMMRRVTIAQAFLGHPELVLLDEPMSGLDPAEVVNIRRLIKRLARRQTIVISSHMLHELQNLCDHVAIIEHGRNVRQETMAAMTRHSHRINYRLDGGAPPLDALADVAPEIAFEWVSENSQLQASYPEDGYSTPEVNGLVLPVLLKAGCRIVEIAQGSDLESEYFQHRGKEA